MIEHASHIQWNVDGLHEYSTFTYDYTPNFYFSYTGVSSANNTGSYAIAIQNRLTSLHNTSHSKLAIFISGKDSEIIARESKKLGIDFELFFLDVGGLNNSMLKIAATLAIILNVKLNVITLQKKEILSFAEESYKITRVNKPTYLILPYMFDKIPKDRYIIVGEGDINKGGNSYTGFKNNKSTDGIPILNTEIAYLIHANNMSINGDFYFHSSSPELIKTVWNHQLLLRRFPYFDTKPIIDFEWDNKLCFTEKTTNWDTIEGIDINRQIRTHLALKYKPSYNVLQCVVNKEVL